MAEPTAQQLARQKLANTDLAKFAPSPPKRSNARNKEWRESHKEQKLESHRKWIANHPGYYTKEAKLKRKEKRENGKGI